MVVLDSSFLVAFHNQRDVHHDAASALAEDLARGALGRALLLEYVFLEVVTVLLARRGHGTAARVGQALLNARELELVPCSDVFLDAFETFRAHGDRGLSFTDAAIVTVARGANEDCLVATFDSGFRSVPGIVVVP